jgi:dipeptidyl aminopeptidase/acylaminoacyl peptidase
MAGRFSFAAMPPKGGPGKHQIFAGSLDSTEHTFLLEATGVPVYAEPGYLLFARDNVILAQRFDARARTLAGEAQALGDMLARTGGRFVAAPAASVSSSGAFAYMGGKLTDTKVALFDRSGREHGVIDVPAGHYAGVSIAPDGRRLALVRRLTTLETDLWLADMARPGASRLTFGGALNTGPVWSADGGRIAFAQAGTGPRNLVVRPSDGSSPEEPLFASPAPFKDALDWSPDGRFVVMGQLDQKTGWDLWILPVAGDRTPKPYLQTPFDEINARISPDGRWLAYVSDESGRSEVYVQSFPTAGNRYQITTQGSGWVRGAAMGASWR